MSGRREPPGGGSWGDQFWRQWATGEDWQSLVATAAAVAYDAVGGARHSKRTIAATIRSVTETDRRLGFKLNDQVDDVVNDVLWTASQIGFALARTWPTGPEELGEWAERAIAYVTLDRDSSEQEEDDEPADDAGE